MRDESASTELTDPAIATPNDNSKLNLCQLIERGEWRQAQSYCQLHPSEVRETDPLTGGTVLHRLCNKPPAPIELFETVIRLFPEAVRIQELSYKATPLHILAWTSQRTVGKVRLLLEYMIPEDLLLRNRFGGTVLHSACGSQASLDVIKAMIAKNPSIVSLRTYEYNHTALTALWHTHLQSIQGHMQIARILKGDEEVNEGHFDRFWQKFEFLARESFRQSPARLDDLDPSNSSDYILHGLLHLRAPLNALKVAVKLRPQSAAVPDANGNYPLHNVIIRRPFRVKDIELIKELLVAFPGAAGKKNKAGDFPIYIAIRDRMGWEEGLGDIVHANVDVLATADMETGLCPFLLAASLGGRVAVNSTFALLSLKPHLVKWAI